VATSTSPVQVDLDAPLEVARWRPLVHWLLAIPHLVIANVLGQVSQVVAFISFFAVLFTTRIPEGLFNFQVMTMRYSFRAYSYALWMREPYPPFEFPMTAEDPGTDAARVSVEYPERLNRWLPLVKWLLLIPHYIVLVFLGIGAFFVIIIGWFAVLITGRWPEGLRNYVVGVIRWGARVEAYLFFLRDEYPPFSLA
jgi:hypothetical protein